MPRIDELRGLWRRSLIAWPDGRRDETTEVHWLQGIEAYVDLRQPVGAPDFSHARGLDDLTLADCRYLATQEGFAGRFSFDGQHFEWARAIDFQPKALYSDAGSLRWEGDILVEEGRDVAYIEHWHRDASTDTTPIAALELRDRQDGTIGAMLRVGPLFMVARDRRVAAPAHMSLAECVADATSLAQARDLVDCEISRGLVEAGSFRITHSTLPWRIGAHLTISPAWDITHAEGDLAALGIIL